MAQHNDTTILSKSPWRQLYQSYRLILRLIYLPMWTALSIPPLTRLGQRWTFKQSLTLYLCHDMVDSEGRVGHTENLTLDPGIEGERFQVIEPFPSTCYRGPLLSSTVFPSKIGGVWFPQPPSSLSSRSTVVLWIHGGAFVTGDGRSSTCSRPANYLLHNANIDAVFSVQYRLSGPEGRNPFPAALQDTLTAYLYLTQTLRFDSSSIVVAGNSSGANLVIAFVRYLEHSMPPLCAVVISPWVAPLETILPGYKRTKDYSAEYVAESFHQWGARSYQPQTDVGKSWPEYITPLGHPFATPIPILATFGELEALSADIASWSEQMQKVPGNKIEVFCDANGIHASIHVGEAMGWGESAEIICSKIGEFIKTSRNR